MRLSAVEYFRVNELRDLLSAALGPDGLIEGRTFDRLFVIGVREIIGPKRTAAVAAGARMVVIDARSGMEIDVSPGRRIR